MRATFDNSVSVLVKAFINDELEFGLCQKCAVGNLVKASAYIGNPEDWMEARPHYPKGPSKIRAYKAIDSIGYSVDEVFKIESAFEAWGKEYSHVDQNDKRDMFKGLMRVVDVLAEIHGIDLSEKESAKALFVKA